MSTRSYLFSPKAILLSVVFIIHTQFVYSQDKSVAKVDSLNSAYGKAEEKSLKHAENLCNEAFTLATKIEYEKGQADALSNLGLVHLRQGNSSKAVENFFAALKIYEKLPGYQNMEQYGLVLVRLGGINYFDGNFDKSLFYCRKALKIAENNQFKRLLGVSSRVIGEVQRDQESYDSAFFYFDKALLAFENDPKNLGAVYIDIGLNYYYKKDYQKAIEYNLKFYNIARQLHYETDYSVGLHNIGEFYYQLKSYDNAIKYLDSAAYYSKKFAQAGSLLDTYKVKAKVYRAIGNADSVAEYYEKSIAMKDSLKSDTYQKELASLNSKLDVYTKEAENKLLRQDKRISTLYRNVAILGFISVAAVLGLVLVRQKFQVQKKVKEKLEHEVQQRTAEIAEQNKIIEQINLKLQLSLSRSKVDPHFVFNVLNSIQHLVLERKPQEASDHLARLSRLTRYILEKSSLEQVPLSDELKMLDQYVKLEQLRLDNKFEYVTLIDCDEQVHIPAMIIQPYIENSILHGLAPCERQGLYLKVSIEEIGEALQIIIEDNGMGRKNKQPRKGHNSIGGSLGSQRLEILSKLEQRNFKCEYEDLTNDIEEPCGTRVTLQVPVKIKELV